MSFLDPYSKNRRVPLLLVARLALLLLVALLAWGAWALWKRLG
ncbi:MAG TPA: hypothetical protein VFF36_02840 [Planctomycetota bacterium]|jgi:hypothetical protein|nr:hypothetical protein [Planctomycetota bacterium]